MAVSPGFRETARFQLRDLPLSPLRSRAVDGCKRGRSAQRYLVEPGREVAGAGMAIVGFGSRGEVFSAVLHFCVPVSRRRPGSN